jgi:hypothetical protein
MDSRIKIVASESVLNYSGGEGFINSLAQYYDVEVLERTSSFEGIGDPMEDLITFFKVEIAGNFIPFIKEYLIKEGAKYVLKELLFKPFLEKLERFKTLNENMPIDRLTFQYDDITIWVGYARKNNVNVVSIMSVEVMKHLPALRESGAGDLNLIASPVVLQGIDWQFVSDKERPITGFTENWGLEFNLNNRLVYHVKSGRQTFAHWWD